MLLNLSDVLKDQGKIEQTTVELEMDHFETRMGDFKITQKTPVAFSFTNIGEGEVRIQGNFSMTLMAACDRCLKELPVSIEVEFDRVALSPDALSEKEADDLSFMDGYQLDVETFAYNELLENWPMKILCKEDCKGVCPKCGQDLNERECGCDTFVPDPRMAAIKDIFESYKEV